MTVTKCFDQVMVVRYDPYLFDYGCVRINCFVDDQMRIIVVKLTWNRDVIEENVCENDFKIELHSIINDLLSCDGTYVPCHGFGDQDTTGVFDVFSRLRKNDIPFILLEKYNGSILYRSRNCRFVINKNERMNAYASKEKSLFENKCDQCIKLYTQIDEKYAFGRFTSPKNKESIKELANSESQDSTEYSLPIPEESSNAIVSKTNDRHIDLHYLPSKKHRRESRLRTKVNRYKDYVVDTEGSAHVSGGSQENTTSANDDTNEDIENIENLPINDGNQKVKIIKTKWCR